MLWLKASATALSRWIPKSASRRISCWASIRAPSLSNESGAPSASPEPQPAVEVLLRYLKAEGVRYVFGIPGGLIFPFVEAVEADAELELIVTRHEEGAAFMADGYARVSGRLAVCTGTSGPGATNLLTGVACAFADGVPMLVITGQAATYALGKGAAQETSREDIDVVAMFKPVTKYSAMAPTAQTLPHHVRRALRHALTGRPGPVHINVPVDLWGQPVVETWLAPESYRPSSRVLDRRAVRQAAEALLAARRPLLLAGSGVNVSQAGLSLRAVAELLPARVATTPRAKGAFPEDHELSLGVLGFGCHREARETALGRDVDVLVTIGASLNETTTFNWNPDLCAGKKLVQIDIDPQCIGRNYPVDVAVEGDADAVLTELHEQLQRGLRGRARTVQAPPRRGGYRAGDGAARLEGRRTGSDPGRPAHRPRAARPRRHRGAGRRHRATSAGGPHSFHRRLH